MLLWQRVILTLIAMVVASVIVGYIWWQIFGFQLPNYLGGMVGGLTALPVWEVLTRVRPKPAGATPPV